MGILDLLLGKENEKPDKCPRCSNRVTGNKKKCDKCGYALDKRMVACPKCKSPLPMNATACPKCGTSLGNQEESKTVWRCPICGYEADYALTVQCPACNTRFV